MLLALVFSAFAGDPPPPTTDPAAPAPVDPCVVVQPSTPAPADTTTTPVPPPTPPVPAVDGAAKCPTTDPAATPAPKGKKSLKKTDNNRMESESTDE